MRADQERRRGDLVELEFDREHVLAFGEASAVGDAEDMRVDRDRRLAERGVEHDVGGLAPDPGELFERCAIGGDLATMFVDQNARGGDDVLGLGVEQADSLDRIAQCVLAKVEHLLRGGDGAVQ